MNPDIVDAIIETYSDNVPNLFEEMEYKQLEIINKRVRDKMAFGFYFLVTYSDDLC